MAIDYQAAGFWLGAGQWTVTIGVALYVAVSNKRRATNKKVDDMQKATGERIDGVDKEIKEHGKQIIALETHLGHLPSQKDLADLNGNISKLSGRLSGINRAVDLLNQHHLGSTD